ncbi:MAG: dehydrogenase [Proteobacteria bacterium ST_bin13]|nr:MAG: dehydrogenase [Proteobacteria bacterium ST_bin13]
MRPFLVLPLLLISCAGVAQRNSPSTSTDKPFTETVIADFDAPWAMTFLPDGRMLVTEKDGRLLLVSGDGKERSVVSGTLPVDSAGQGGLMDVVLAPGFATNHQVYFSFSENGEGGKGVVLARGVLAIQQVQCIRAPCPPIVRLDKVEVLHRATPYAPGNGHYSGRIAFSPDGQYLFYTNGERQKFDPAQDMTVTLGKVLRLTLDGKPASGNPFYPETPVKAAIWSYGHRNLLGLAFDADGRLWEQEMGPRGGDELNLIEPGKNYGWPRVSNGSHYDGRDIPDHAAGDGYEPPKVFWNPVISPGGLMIYSGKLFPAWKGDAFIGGLSSQALVRVDLNGASAKKGDQWDMGARIREVEQGPDGAIYVLEDGDDGSQGRLIRLTPKG